ncbi:hypothetical protein U2057_15435, partial [Listeria monocytogenes]|uniref:hypothetical protein n=1 Tax=Listeria monocytogenes TaxID=1639 RepID=UPI002FDBB551
MILPPTLEDITSRLVFDGAGMTEDEMAEMKTRVTNHLITMMRVKDALNVPANWTALAEAIAVSCDLADNT